MYLYKIIFLGQADNAHTCFYYATFNICHYLVPLTMMQCVLELPSYYYQHSTLPTVKKIPHLIDQYYYFFILIIIRHII